jgi:uncharacterized membrane protein YccC
MAKVMSDIEIHLERPRVEKLLAPYRQKIGRDYEGYRNHVMRTVTYAMHFLHQDLKWAALVETHRQTDCSVALPAVLHPYLRGATSIGP